VGSGGGTESGSASVVTTGTAGAGLGGSSASSVSRSESTTATVAYGPWGGPATPTGGEGGWGDGGDDGSGWDGGGETGPVCFSSLASSLLLISLPHQSIMKRHYYEESLYALFPPSSRFQKSPFHPPLPHFLFLFPFPTDLSPRTFHKKPTLP